MSALRQLVADCEAMDITNQIYVFDDAFLAYEARKELKLLEAMNEPLPCGHATRYLLDLEETGTRPCLKCFYESYG